MIGRLQRFDFRSSPYERPTQAWVCGAAAGKECRVGPDGRGRCRATAECQPVRTGDRWVCTRPETAGGKCTDGPRPDGSCACPIPTCAPVPSLRRRRHRAVMWTVAVTIGFLAIVFGHAEAPGVPEPGEITVKHSNVGGCDACHGTAAEGAGDWTVAAFAKADPVAESGRCLNCHKVGSKPLNAHGVDADDLEKLTVAIRERTADAAPIPIKLASAVFPLPGQFDEAVPCATCHTEHQGPVFDLTGMANDRCQACHTARFSSLSDGHPDFADFPYMRRTRIIFDHNTHFGRHFPEAGEDKAPTSCNACHETDPTGTLMLARSFASSCQDCHIGQITGAQRATGPKGIGVLSVPGLDVETLRDRGVPIGEWPELSEAGIVPVMELLLGVDERYAEDLRVLGSMDLLDLVDATEADLAAVERVAWAVKSLLYDLAVLGIGDLSGRIEDAVRLPLDDVARARLVASLPRDVVVGALGDWFPNIAQEIRRHRAGERIPVPAGEDDSADAGVQPEPEAAAADATDGDILGDDDGGDILGDDDGGDILADDDGGDILGDDDGGDILGDDDGGDILGDDDGGDILDGDEDVAAEEDADEADGDEAVLSEVDEEAWAGLGGWYRRDFTLYFRPTGHADRFIRTWLDISAATYGTEAEDRGRILFTELTTKDAPGQCAKCHSIDTEITGILNIKWHPVRPKEDRKPFTWFPHAAHFGMLRDDGCLTCHRIDPQAPYQKSFEDLDPTTFASNFKPLDRQVCVECHTADGAGDACTSCHNYHAGPALPPALVTPLPGSEKAETKME